MVRTGGMTLVEILVVLGLLVALTSIGLAAFTGTNRVNRLTATRDLVSDLVRQARTTARTSGRPVRLEVRQSGTGGAISGVVQVPLMHLDFSLDPTAGPTPSPFRTTDGFRGRGLILGTPPDHDVTIPQPPPAGDRPVLEPRYRLGPDDGFLLTIAVRLPAPTPGAVVPLVMLTSTPASDHATASIAGLRMVGVRLQGLPNPHGVKQVGDGSPLWNQPFSVWMLQGWIMTTGGTPQRISELLWPLDRAQNPWAADHQLRDRALLETARDGGGRWVTCGLLWDGEDLALLRDGRPVAVRNLGTTSLHRHSDPDQGLIVGHGTFPAWGDEASGNGAPVWPWPEPGNAGQVSMPPEDAVVDEVSLDRLSRDAGHPLPGGVIADPARQILVFWPDGAVGEGLKATSAHLHAATPAAPLNLRFRGVAEDQDTAVTLTLSPTTGAILSQTVDARP